MKKVLKFTMELEIDEDGGSLSITILIKYVIMIKFKSLIVEVHCE